MNRFTEAEKEIWLVSTYDNKKQKRCKTVPFFHVYHLLSQFTKGNRHLLIISGPEQ